MERNDQSNRFEPIELGAVSTETRGDTAPNWEAVGLRSGPGLADD